MTTPLRVRFQAQRNLRRLFENLVQLRKDRPSTLTEIPIPGTTTQPKKKSKVQRSQTLKDPPLPVIPNLARPLVLTQSLNAAPAVEQKIRKWESVEELQNAVLDEGDSGGGVDVRIFEQTVRGQVDMIDRRRLEEFTPTEVYVLKRLERALLLLERNPVLLKKEIFYWLGRTKNTPWVLRVLTEYAWRTIWALETDEIPTSRSKLIGDLMTSTAIPLSEDQEIAYIGGLFWNDARSQAMERWRNRIRLSPNSVSRKFWNLGVRLLALDLNPEAAYYTIQRMQEYLVPIDYRDYIPVVMAYNHIGQPIKARETYKKMKRCAKVNGDMVKTKVYDDISMSFLDAGEMEVGLSVYKEMMFTGNKILEKIHDDAMAEKEEASENSNKPLEDIQEEVEEGEEPSPADLSLEDLKKLPYEKWDQYFIEGWMQSLLRMGRSDLVYILITSDLPKRGFATDSVHFNWVIKGFLAEGNIEMAEYVAEAMIQETIKKRSSSPSPEEKDREEEHGERLITPPKATLHTFSQLILHFSRAQRIDRVAFYSNLLSQTPLQTNSYIYNHILYSLYRLHSHERFDSAFSSMLSEPTLHPDAETWQIVWAAHRRRLTLLRNSPRTHHRYLFNEMVRTLLPPLSQQQRRLVQAFWPKLVKCFVIVQDFDGLLVALHAGVKLWSVELDSTVLREVTVGVLKSRRRYVPDSAGGVVRTVVGKETVDASAWYLIKRGVKIMKRKRGAAVAVRRVVGGKVVGGKARRKKKKLFEGNLSSVSELLTMELLARPGYASDGFLEKLREAKRELGVEGLVIEW
ncbi:hypothetical protein L873DRAFT_1804586 [Choiromyces venosus 120613-1]|uniref:TPR-like protein n=1 Tax=Choiromyces venosus 120613-1 TaxID=1336337 RepID=A0A3N4JUW9_9PEZI|nr:hypothetical protein L873DRAFT_1804586 [Choiromyces venosus 120613-1]